MEPTERIQSGFTLLFVLLLRNPAEAGCSVKLVETGPCRPDLRHLHVGINPLGESYEMGQSRRTRVVPQNEFDQLADTPVTQ